MIKKILLLVCLSFVSCSETYENQILEFAKKKYGSNFENHEIDLKEVFPFAWDTLYIFPPVTYSKDVTKELGFDCNCEMVPDDNYFYLFVKGRKIVGQQLISDNILDFDNNNITSTGTKIIVNEQAKFKIKKLKVDNEYYIYQ